MTRNIALLRRLLGDDIHEPRYIATVPTVGYHLVCKVEVSEEPSGTSNAADERNGLSGRAPENAAASGAVVDHPARMLKPYLGGISSEIFLAGFELLTFVLNGGARSEARVHAYLRRFGKQRLALRFHLSRYTQEECYVGRIFGSERSNSELARRSGGWTGFGIAVQIDCLAEQLLIASNAAFFGIDEPESPQWNIDAQGPMKQTRGLALIRCLRETALGAVLHALSENGQKVYVFTVTTTSASPAPGSSYNILGPLNMIVQPR